MRAVRRPYAMRVRASARTRPAALPVRRTGSGAEQHPAEALLAVVAAVVTALVRCSPGRGLRGGVGLLGGVGLGGGRRGRGLLCPLRLQAGQGLQLAVVKEYPPA